MSSLIHRFVAAVERQPAAAFVVVVVAGAYSGWLSLPARRRAEPVPKRRSQFAMPPPTATAPRLADQPPPLVVVYVTTTGTSRKLAEELAADARRAHPGVAAEAINCERFDAWELLDRRKGDDVVFVVSTWSQGAPPPSGRELFSAVEDWEADHRIASGALSESRIGVFAVGCAEYSAEHFCTAGIKLAESLDGLGARPLVRGADAVVAETGDEAAGLLSEFADFKDRVLHARAATAAAAAADRAAAAGCCGGGGGGAASSESASASASSSCGCSDTAAAAAAEAPRKFPRKPKHDQRAPPAPRTAEDEINDKYVAEDDPGGAAAAAPASTSGDGLTDLEDLGTVMSAAKADRAAQAAAAEPAEMVTPLQRQALTKEGYRIIGSHSAVKLCRWTKASLRGRGGCYKHTFYGISSHNCMEATPSLACANKCVFCWRHHKNPVGREWRWKTDDPVRIVDEAVENHASLVKQLRGVPGLQLDRFEEASTVKHCALSLVGEPIMYPRINELLDSLHKRRISTFLVTNAQFPSQISALVPVTQLYVSIDAGNPEDLQKIDRPLFADYWERFIGSLRSLRAKQQRTVYRLTLVKGWNMDQIDEYAQLLELGLPDFIEIKAVTYSGKSDASDLTVKDSPWHEEVRRFGMALAAAAQSRKAAQPPLDYECCCEHKHSCSVLLARTSKYRDAPGMGGKWHTFIDYDKFSALANAFAAGGPAFTAADYTEATPDWALFGAEGGGFEPLDTRHYRPGAQDRRVKIMASQGIEA